MKTVTSPPPQNKYILKPKQADWYLLYETKSGQQKLRVEESHAPFVFAVGHTEEKVGKPIILQYCYRTS